MTRSRRPRLGTSCAGRKAPSAARARRSRRSQESPSERLRCSQRRPLALPGSIRTRTTRKDRPCSTSAGRRAAAPQGAHRPHRRLPGGRHRSRSPRSAGLDEQGEVLDPLTGVGTEMTVIARSPLPDPSDGGGPPSSPRRSRSSFSARAGTAGGAGRPRQGGLEVRHLPVPLDRSQLPGREGEPDRVGRWGGVHPA